ncbi:zinc carboxypeptidase family protein (macronuclear) [Tetrahymena thermophila SB210]|uniref:Zinc carboxypeptidase family protein n=1 Tax=Tetrahymena thermophila (strain SB210) TaxID=312017 RepID=Q23AU3_TETTS|nr:zinc carboxypeptidase family protein [Tetrahymena thermophila SB210]EAR93599.3 zinc carboxypeptidase family protein [Tetrahymena thermophila SB210]|eukprot:XP_001013844.3 zinc carboxypeptidase family protein [Tetrahymena thermophila SB210]
MVQFQSFQYQKRRESQIQHSKFHQKEIFGLKPFVKSKEAQERKKIEWHQSGTNIQYQERRILKYDYKISRKTYYILSFEYQFEYDDDEVQFAQIQPYTYSYLINMLKPVIYNQLNDDCKNSYLQESTICKSLSGIPVQMLSITDYLDQSLNLSLRKVVVIIARMHPGEAPGSWMCHGLIESLLSQNAEIQQIRKKVIFKVIPMMNPDGVIIGNYRTGLAGLDLNRQFGDNNLTGVTNQLFPSVQALKNLIRDLKEQYGKNMLGLIDLHGHSVKKNIFTFGPYYPPTDFRYYRSKFIPKLLEKVSQYFRFYSCIYNSQKANKSTARVSFLNKYNLEICYTIEGTFGLYYNSETKSTEYMNTVDWINFGKQLPLALKQYIEMMETYNVIKEAQDQKTQQERNASPLKRNNNLSPIRINSITKIKQFQTSRDISEQGDFIPFDESQVYNLGGLLKEIQNDELKINNQSDQQEEADSSDQYSDNLADSEPSDEDIPSIQRSKLFQNIDNYQKNFMKFITGKKKKEQLIIQGGEEKRDKIITHKLKRSAISEDTREQEAQKKKKKSKKKKKDQSLVLQKEDLIMKDNSDIQKSMKRLDNIRQSQKKLNLQNDLKFSELSSIGQYQRSLPYIEDENYEESAQNMFLADLKKKKKARIKLRISQNNSMIESQNDSISYNPGQNIRSSYLDDEDEQIDQYKIMHLSRKYQSNQSPDQLKNKSSPFRKQDNDQLYYQYPDQQNQNEIDFNNQAMFYQLKNNLPHYYKRIPKNRVPLKLNIICDKFQTGSQKQPQQQQQQQQKQQQQQLQNSFQQEQQMQKQPLYGAEQPRNYYNLNINHNTPKPQNLNNTSTNINYEYQNPPSPIYNQRVHENLYNQIIQSAIKGNITHKSENKQNQFNSETSSPNKPPISINELKLPIIQNKHTRAFSNNQNNMSNRNSKTINIYQMPIMEQAGVDKIDFDMFKKEIMRFKRGSHLSKPQQPESKIISSHNTYSVSPNQHRASSQNIQQQSQIIPQFPQFLN